MKHDFSDLGGKHGTIRSPQVSRHSFPFAAALAITLIMGVGITALDAFQPAEPVLSILAFIPGAISIAAPFSPWGRIRADMYLRSAKASLPGLAVLAAVTLLSLPIPGSNTGWTGWHWLPALVYAPASGIAQELYFRASLLPALERALRGKKTTAILLHSIIFVSYHFRTFQSVQLFPIGILIATVLFSAGCGWAWQVQRDRTVLWAIGQHCLFLMLAPSTFDSGLTERIRECVNGSPAITKAAENVGRSVCKRLYFPHTALTSPGKISPDFP